MKTDNELIAEFMGINKLHDSNGILWDTSQTGKEIYGLRSEYLRYDSSWEWLMPVVKKIYEISDPDMRELFDDLFELRITSSRNTVYNAITEFIKWHNSQKL